MNKTYYCIYMILTLWANPPMLHADETADFQQARIWFNQALYSNEGALKHATKQFTQLLSTNPDHPVYRAFLGACKTLKGREAWMPWDKMRYTELGLDDIDKALNLLDETHDTKLLLGTSLRLQTMLVAATTFLNVPDKIFHRHAKGVRYLGKLMVDPAYASSSETFKQAAHRATALAKGGAT